MQIAGLMRENYPCNDAAENYIYEQKRGMIHDRDMHARPVLFGLRLKQKYAHPYQPNCMAYALLISAKEGQ
jgi:hypothetical protein